MEPRGRVLIADDEPNIIRSLKVALELESYAVLAKTSLADAIQALETEDFEVALVDLKFPDGLGTDFLAAVRAQGSEVPVIMMSGHASIEDAVRALQFGATDFLEKPVSHERLFVTLQNTLEMRRLRRENLLLKDEVKHRKREEEMLGRSSTMHQLREQILRVAQSEGRVLITGENGTGKELVARAIHDESRRREHPFVSVNCAAVPAELIESELFGHEKGAFTGATGRKLGKFEAAHHGTLFLDEVGDTPPPMQAKLLRVLQTGEFERVGGNRSIKVDVRVLSATNKDLEREVSEGRFREDLFYRLNVVPIVVPPLRARKEDIPVMVDAFLQEAAIKNHRTPQRLTDAAMALLSGHDYPGNIRELRNLIERIVILAPPEVNRLDEGHIRHLIPSKSRPMAIAYRDGSRLSELMEEAERAVCIQALEAHQGVIAEAARALGVDRSNFHKKLRALGIK